MKLKFAFARKVAVGLMAIAVAAAGANAFAANYTWKGGTTLATRNWQTASNWAQTAPTAVVPPDFSNVFIGPINGGTLATPVQRQIAVGTDTNEITSLEFTSNHAAYTFTGNGSVVVNGAIVNNSTALTSTGTGLASVQLRFVTLNGDTNLSGSGAATEIFLGITSADPLNPSTLTVNGNSLILQGTSVGVNVTAGTGSTVQLDGLPSLLDLTIGAAGTLSGLANRDPGVFFNAGAEGTLDLKNGSTSTFGVMGSLDGEYDAYATTGPVQFGGELNIDWSQVGSTTFSTWTNFNLFEGSSYAGNFSQVNLNGAVAPYDTLAFTQFGTEWSTQPFVGQGGQQQWLVFQAQSGNLVVVPEPSTIVFAGLGVAMSGWTMWKKRRLSKLLAAKAG